MSGIYPFGDKSILRMDLIHQYAPFLSLFRDKLKNGESLLYSFDIGMGINFLALYVYYLASPLNLILVFVSGKFLIEAITALILIKVGACGLFMGVLFKETRRTCRNPSNTVFQQHMHCPDISARIPGTSCGWMR